MGGTLLRAVSVDAQPSKDKLRSAAAIIVLGGTFDAAEDGGVPGALTLERLAKAATLHRAHDLPILVTAGQLKHMTEPGAAIMERSLREVFGVPVRWQEASAMNTRENALEAAKTLQNAEISRALVVTHSWHLRRAMLAFETTQLEVIPVGVHPMPPAGAFGWRDILPTLAGLEASYYALYETLGFIWYRIRR
nr:YdcF family protein [Rhodovibrio sodomensis]